MGQNLDEGKRVQCVYVQGVVYKVSTPPQVGRCCKPVASDTIDQFLEDCRW